MSNELYHWGVKGMRWGVRRYRNKDGMLTPAGKKRADKEKAKMDAKDLEYYRNNVGGFDLASARSRKLAGKQIEARGKAWIDYCVASDLGKIDNEKTRVLRKKYDEATNDVFNALISDVRVPSGRTPKWVMDETGKSKLIFE